MDFPDVSNVFSLFWKRKMGSNTSNVFIRVKQRFQTVLENSIARRIYPIPKTEFPESNGFFLSQFSRQQVDSLQNRFQLTRGKTGGWGGGGDSRDRYCQVAFFIATFLKSIALLKFR